MTEKGNQFFQQMHRKCGGAIIVVAGESGVELLCRDCSKAWPVSLAKLPKDFAPVKDGIKLTP